MSKIHFIKGFFVHFFNISISKLAFVSSTNSLANSVSIYRGVKIKGSHVGSYSYIGPYTDVENVVIGRFCSIADHCRIGLANHTLDLLSTSPVFTLENNAVKTKWVENNVNIESSKIVTIGNDVWIGSHALILGRVKIGDGAVIGAGAVVTKNVPPYAVVGGVPARIIKYRFSQEIIDKLLEIKWWNLPENILKENIGLFQTDNITLDLLQKFSQLKNKS